jgi:hypothetical protein
LPAQVEKMNKLGKLQRRVLCVTESTVYNLDAQLRINWSQPLEGLRVAVR